jgi:hypothetical protein
VSYKKAMQQCRRVGTARATGDALRAMYAALLVTQHGGDAEAYYRALGGTADDRATTTAAREMLRDRARAWGVLIS